MRYIVKDLMDRLTIKKSLIFNKDITEIVDEDKAKRARREQVRTIRLIAFYPRVSNIKNRLPLLFEYREILKNQIVDNTGTLREHVMVIDTRTKRSRHLSLGLAIEDCLKGCRSYFDGEFNWDEKLDSWHDELKLLIENNVDNILIMRDKKDYIAVRDQYQKKKDCFYTIFEVCIKNSQLAVFTAKSAIEHFNRCRN